MTMKSAPSLMEIGSATDVGCVRTLNEDTIIAQHLTEDTQNPWHFSALIAVADGMGGLDRGEVASQSAVGAIQLIFASDRTAPFLQSEVTGVDLLNQLTEAVQQINRTVYETVASGGSSNSGTTLTLCLVRPLEYCVGHVGDSRAYLLRANSIEQITEDDSYVAEMVRRGRMTEEEAMQSKMSNLITKAIGLQSEVEPSIYYGHWRSGDVLLVCSDGFYEYIRAPELLSIAQSEPDLQRLCEHCVQLAKERGGHDNISVAAVRNTTFGDKPGTPFQPKTWPPADGAPETIIGITREGNRRKRSAGWDWDKDQIRLVIIGAILFGLTFAAGFWIAKKQAATPHDKNHPTSTQPNTSRKSTSFKRRLQPLKENS